jgi:hypothetical protein
MRDFKAFLPFRFTKRKAGLLWSVAALFALAEPGAWYDPSDVANLGWRRNLLTFTEQFDNAAWVVGSPATTVSANQIAAPDGTLTADRLTEEATSAVHYRSQNASIVSGSVYTISMYVKKGIGATAPDWVQLTHGSPAFGASQHANFNISTGAVGTVVGGTAQISDAGSGWYRLSFTATAISTTTAACGLVFTNNNNAAGRTPSYLGAITSDVYLWGAQLETGSTATAYQRVTDVNTEVLERFPSATLFQDTAGTAPVTTPGQAVALVLDKSKGLVLGPELVTNGTFDADLTGWTASGSGGTSAWADGKMVFTHDPTLTGTFNRSQNISVTSGATYRLSFSYFAGANAFGRINVPGIGNVNAPNTEQTIHLIVLATTSTLTLTFTAVSNSSRSGIVTVDNVSVRELPGAHATQATVASRPILGREPVGGRRNLLTRTEEFEVSPWVSFTTPTTVTANNATAPDGSMTADRFVVGGADGVRSQSINVVNGQTYTFSCWIKGTAGETLRFGGVNQGLTEKTITLTSDWVRYTHTTTAANTGSGGFFPASTFSGATARTFWVWGAQLELGSTATNYQRVTTAFDVTEQGVADTHYLFFDGVDDFLVTPTITPGGDKAQIFAGVRKLSDAATGVLVETSVNSGVNAGSFLLVAPSTLPETRGYRLRSGGSIPNAATVDSAAFNAPITNVVTGLIDISAYTASLRVNGAVSGTPSTADQGTGNFLAYPLYIGTRSATATPLPFNGRIYSLIVRFGSNLDAATITNAEKFVAGKTGITI